MEQDLRNITSKPMLGRRIEGALRQVVEASHATVYMRYEAQRGNEPVEQQIGNKNDGFENIPVQINNFEGIAAWYIINRNNDTYEATKLVIERYGNKITDCRLGNFEGFWDEVDQFIIKDKWVFSAIAKRVANDRQATAQMLDVVNGG